MKKWLYLTGALAAVGILARLPHPARDIARLKPVRAVYLYMEQGALTIETDTGDAGAGADVAEACADLRAGADGEIFLDTARYLILSREVPVTDAFYALFRPGCRVVYTNDLPDLEKVSDYLDIHNPPLTLANLRALHKWEERSRHENQTTDPVAPGCAGCAGGPFFRQRLGDVPGGCGGGAAPDPDPEGMGRTVKADGGASNGLARCRDRYAASGGCGVLAIRQ